MVARTFSNSLISQRLSLQALRGETWEYTNSKQVKIKSKQLGTKKMSGNATNQCGQTEHLEEKCKAHKPKAAEAEKEGRMLRGQRENYGVGCKHAT